MTDDYIPIYSDAEYYVVKYSPRYAQFIMINIKTHKEMTFYILDSDHYTKVENIGSIYEHPEFFE
jgi:hypothetical protein